MPILNLTIFSLLTITLYFWLNNIVRAKLQIKIFAYQKTQDKKKQLATDYAALAEESLCLKHGLDETIELYEITKEICKSLEQDKVFAIFNEKIKKYLQIQDCQFLKTNEILLNSSGWVIFPLQIGESSLGNLAVKGLNEKDVEKFHILSQQFLLGLKRVIFYQGIQEIATLDSLTQIFTRRYWLQRCTEELSRSKKFSYPLTCLMIDVDKFKNFNDTFGHLVGDAILAAIAKIIKENIREIDILGKYGGEEFCVVLSETDVQDAQFVAERIRHAIEDANIRAYDEILKVTISIGIAEFPKDSQDLTELIDKADQALYLAKETGRNKVCAYNP